MHVLLQQLRFHSTEVCNSPSTSFSLTVLLLDEESEFAAIKGIHGQLDDNADGTVDFSESEEVREGRNKCVYSWREGFILCDTHQTTHVYVGAMCLRVLCMLGVGLS